jgi:hypothetical protein
MQTDPDPAMEPVSVMGKSYCIQYLRINFINCSSLGPNMPQLYADTAPVLIKIKSDHCSSVLILIFSKRWLNRCRMSEDPDPVAVPDTAPVPNSLPVKTKLSADPAPVRALIKINSAQGLSVFILTHTNHCPHRCRMSADPDPAEVTVFLHYFCTNSSRHRPRLTADQESATTPDTVPVPVSVPVKTKILGPIHHYYCKRMRFMTFILFFLFLIHIPNSIIDFFW